VDVDVDAQVATFLADQRKKGCEMLTPEMVAKVLEVPAAELEQKRIMGCIYSWEGGELQADASIMSIWVKKTPQEARTWFDNSTKDKTPEEIAAEMAKVEEIAKDRGKLDTKPKEAVADQVGGMITGMTPDEGYHYEDVPGVGDAARVKTHDGSVTVLVGNMIFNLRAYKGGPAPKPDMAAMTSGDMKKVIAASKESEAKWMEQTRDVRRTLAVALAKVVVAGL
ncbi:MAG: hypothetical protein KC501_05950, partial [Myxococcales bacterium]|nr:hypothetical protein [Myxococcales bacterium]